MKDSDVVAARRPIKLGGKEFNASPLDDRDVSELDEWIRSHYIEMARQSLKEDTPERDRELTMRVAMNTAMTLTWMSGQGARIIGTMDGLVRLAWQMIHRNHPNVTIEELRGHIVDAANERRQEDNVRRVNDTFEELNSASFVKAKKKNRPATRKH